MRFRRRRSAGSGRRLVPKESLPDLLHEAKFTRLDKLLICLGVSYRTPKRPRDVEALAAGAGLRAVKRWNVSDILAGSKGLAANTDDGWRLSAAGIEHIRKLAGPRLSVAPPPLALTLRGHLSRIKQPHLAEFVEEAIKCFEARLYRSAVVLSWVGALALLYDYVVANELAAFNAEATRRTANSKNPWKPAKTADDLALMKEHEFLQVIEHISVIGKTVKQELEARLKLRNGCGHPNSFALAENTVAAHVEQLILNVYAKFG